MSQSLVASFDFGSWRWSPGGTFVYCFMFQAVSQPSVNHQYYTIMMFYPFCLSCTLNLIFFDHCLHYMAESIPGHVRPCRPSYPLTQYINILILLYCHVHSGAYTCHMSINIHSLSYDGFMNLYVVNISSNFVLLWVVLSLCMLCF